MTELIDQVNMLRKDVLPGRPIESSKIPTYPSTKKKTESSSKVTTRLHFSLALYINFVNSEEPLINPFIGFSTFDRYHLGKIC